MSVEFDMVLIQIFAHIGVTVLAVAAIAVRLEHRLTKIETDVTWLKKYAQDNCKRSSEDGQDTKGDQS